jgi:hypothetical protein
MEGTMTETWDLERLNEFIREEWGDDAPEVIRQVSVWYARGDGAAIYRNHDLGHPQVGMPKIASYGSPYAQLEVDTVHVTNDSTDGKAVERAQRTMAAWHERGYKVAPVPEDGQEHVRDKVCPACSVPPAQLPDIGGAINWRFRLEATCRKELAR